jgi:type IV pilus assembly protein PilM
MAKKLNSILGVDIGSQKIKVAELKTQGREPIITALGITDTPEGAVDHAGVWNSDAVGDTLKRLLKECGASVSHVIVTISGQASVLVRTLEVPRMNPTELREHMQWEINRNIPFTESTVVSDYKPLADEDPNSPNMDVVMAIAPQTAIDTMIACIKRAGKTAAAIDVEPLSVARSLQYSYEDVMMGQTVCFVDMGNKTTAINIYRDGKLLMPRQIPLGGEMFTQKLADALNIPVDEAEQLKVERLEVPHSAGGDSAILSDPFGAPAPALGTPTLAGTVDEFQPYNPFADDVPISPGPMAEPTAAPLPDDTGTGYGTYDPLSGEPVAPAPAEPDFGATGVFDPMSDVPLTPEPYGAAPSLEHSADVDPEVMRLYSAVAPVFEEFVAEIRRSVDYFRSRGGDVQRVMLAGGGTRIKGLPEFVTRSLGVECDVYDPTRRLKVNPKKVAPGFAEDHRQEFAVAIGNALHIFFD